MFASASGRPSDAIDRRDRRPLLLVERAVGREHRAEDAHRERPVALHAGHFLVARLAREQAAEAARADLERHLLAHDLHHRHPDRRRDRRERARHLDEPGRELRRHPRVGLALDGRRVGVAAPHEDAVERVLRVPRAGGQDVDGVLAEHGDQAVERGRRQVRVLGHGGDGSRKVGRRWRSRLPVVMRWPLAFLLLPMTACLQLSTGDGTGTTTGSSGSSSGGTATASSGLQQQQRRRDERHELHDRPAVGHHPLRADRQLPRRRRRSGARSRAAASGCTPSSIYDLECGCGDSLCPIGTPTSCTTALQLLDQQQSSHRRLRAAGPGHVPAPRRRCGLAAAAATRAARASAPGTRTASRCAGADERLHLAPAAAS